MEVQPRGHQLFYASPTPIAPLALIAMLMVGGFPP